MATQSPLFIKTEVFMLWLFNHTLRFPREERFRLAARIDQTAFKFHESLLYAAKSKDLHLYLNQADAELDMLRTYLRFSLELTYSSNRQYHYASTHLTEIGKLLGAWKKRVQV